MKTLTHNHIASWASRWMAAKRPGVVKEFYTTEMLFDFQIHLQEMGASDDAKNVQVQTDDPPGLPRKSDL